MFEPTTFAALLTTIAQYLQERRSRDDASQAETLRDYMEWLRRKEHNELLKAIEQNETGMRAIALTLEDIHNQLATQDVRVGERVEAILRDYSHSAGDESGWLTRLSRSTRARQEIPLIGREREMAWLEAEVARDCVIAGQPGSGKSYLVETFLRARDGRFAHCDGEGSLFRSIRAIGPDVIAVDDAGNKYELLAKLVQLREEHDLGYALVGVCWPSETRKVAEWLRQPSSAVHELQPLTRDEIVQITRTVGLTGPPSLVWTIVNQAEGKPGLAVTLADLSLKEGWQEVWDGRALAQAVGSWIEPIAGSTAMVALAAFSFGGDEGMSTTDVAEFTGIAHAALSCMLRDVALNGVLHEVSESHMSVRPELLRHVLMKEYCFSGAYSVDPSPLLRSLTPEARATALLGVERVGGQVSAERLLAAVEEVRPLPGRWSKLPASWESYAFLGATEAEEALRRFPDRVLDLAEPLLTHSPAVAIRALLNKAATGRDPERKLDADPMTVLTNWVSRPHGRSEEAVSRRRAVLSCAIAWLRDEDLPTEVGVRAMILAFQPTFHSSSLDPGAGRTVKIERGTLDPDRLNEVAQTWHLALECLRDLDVRDWCPFMGLIRSWAIPDYHLHSVPATEAGQAFKAEVRSAMLTLARSMAADVATLSRGHIGVHHVLQRDFEVLLPEAGVGLGQDFEALYFRVGWSDDRETRLATHRDEVVALAAVWAELEPQVIAERVAALETRACEAGVESQGWIGILCTAIADTVNEASSWVTSMLDAECPAEAVMPFVDRSLGNEEPQATSLIQRCLGLSGTEKATILAVLQMASPDRQVLESVLERLGSEDSELDIRCVCRNAPIETMKLLLRHTRREVVGQAAVGEWFMGDAGVIRPELEECWRTAVVESVEDDYALSAIFQQYPDLAFGWASHHLDQRDSFMHEFETTIPVLRQVLSIEQRRELVAQIKTDETSRVLVQCLVGSDPSIYGVLLKQHPPCALTVAPLRQSRLFPMDLDEWMALAEAAFEHDVDPAEIAFAALYPDGAFRHGTEVWEERKKWYGQLLSHTNEKIRAIGTQGEDLAQAELDCVGAEEQHEAVYGLR